jgi:hypothetical protein
MPMTMTEDVPKRWGMLARFIQVTARICLSTFTAALC